jgi:GAF domain-containing protein
MSGTHPDRVGIPPGHPPITSFLGVPLRRGSEIFGMIGLANKESGYDPADQQAVEALSESFVEVLMHKRAEKEYRTSQEHLKRMLEERGAKLTAANEGLQKEIAEHRQTKEKRRRILRNRSESNG